MRVYIYVYAYYSLANMYVAQSDISHNPILMEETYTVPLSAVSGSSVPSVLVGPETGDFEKLLNEQAVNKTRRIRSEHGGRAQFRSFVDIIGHAV